MTAQTPGVDAAPTPNAAPTPAAMGWGASNYSSAATPATGYGGWGSMGQASSWGATASNTSSGPAEDWLFDPAIMPYHSRIKIEISGTKAAVPQYYGGDYEGRRGRVSAGTKAPAGSVQTVTVTFENGEATSFVAKYVKPVVPSMEGQEVLVIAGPYKGQVMIVRETDDDMCTVSTRTDPGNVRPIVKDLMVSLYDDQ